MGLDTTHDAWHGSYAAFSRWRDKLAEVAGYTFHIMVDLDWGGIESLIGSDLNGKWPRMPVRHDGTPDPLIVLLAHSDCDGVIQTEFCAPLADRLEELLPLLGEDEGGVESYAEKTQKFIDGLRTAADTGEDLGFH